MFYPIRYPRAMTDPADRLAAASPEALAFALCFNGRKRKHDGHGFMARIVAKRLVEHLDDAG